VRACVRAWACAFVWNGMLKMFRLWITSLTSQCSVCLSLFH